MIAQQNYTPLPIQFLQNEGPPTKKLFIILGVIFLLVIGTGIGYLQISLSSKANTPVTTQYQPTTIPTQLPSLTPTTSPKTTKTTNNPFADNTVYQNPFSENTNPFDSLKQ